MMILLMARLETTTRYLYVFSYHPSWGTVELAGMPRQLCDKAQGSHTVECGG